MYTSLKKIVGVQLCLIYILTQTTWSIPTEEDTEKRGCLSFLFQTFKKEKNKEKKYITQNKQGKDNKKENSNHKVITTIKIDVNAEDSDGKIDFERLKNEKRPISFIDIDDLLYNNLNLKNFK